MREGYWVIRTYVAGNVGEKTKFFIPGDRSFSAKGRRREQKEIKKQEQNEYSAVKSLARLFNANIKQGDILLGLDYSDKGISKLEKAIEKKGVVLSSLSEEERADVLREAAEHELVLLWRRVKRELEKEGIEFKCYGAVTADIDGESGESVRVHHHLVINGESLGAVIKKWRLGGVDYKTVRKSDDYTPMAEYFLRQVRRVPNAKKYISTRNIERPVPRDRVCTSDAELRAPKGAKLLHRSEYSPGTAQYIRYTIKSSDGGRWDEELRE